VNAFQAKEALVKLHWRRNWPVAALVFAALAVGIVLLAAERLSREPPNFSRIENGLWMGGRVAEPPPGTQAVLNLCDADDSYHVESYKWDPIRDAAPAPSLDWLAAQVGFIELERAAGRTVYVHCMAGVSRSGMVMAAYFMKREGWSCDRALDFLQDRRPGVRPNPAFMDLLLEWDQRLKR
jgi:Dual specificity phosphatase, catalytic domain